MHVLNKLIIEMLVFNIFIWNYNSDIYAIKKFNDYSIFYERISISRCNIITSPKIKKIFYKYIVLTLSKPCNILNRNIQRYFRRNYIDNALFLFVIGNDTNKKMIIYEENTYEDIIFLNINNHYFNITSLFLASVSWININLNYDYLIKWDIDIIVNMPLLYLFINSQHLSIDYAGYLYDKTSICRDKNKICYIPYSIYKYSFLPSFEASGILILSKYISKNINDYQKIYKSYLIRDDQYIGVLCNLLSIKPISINRYYLRVNQINYTVNIHKLLSYHTDNRGELKAIYKKLYER